MTVTNLQFVLISLFFSFTCSFSPLYMISYPLAQPLVIGWGVGVILGDPMGGAMLGAFIGLIYLGNISVVGTQAANPMVATTIAVTFGLIQGLDQEAAIALAIPLGIACAALRNWVNTATVFVYSGIMRAVKNRKPNGTWLWATIGILFKMAVYFIMMFVILRFGVTAVSGALDNMPAWLTRGLNVAGGALPAAGIALGLARIGSKGRILFVVISFIACKYLGFGTLVCVVIVACAVIFVLITKVQKGEIDLSFFKEEGQAPTQHVLSKRDVYSATFWCENLMEWGNNNATKLAPSFLTVLTRIMKKLYPGDVDKQCEELSKYDIYITTNQQFIPLLIGCDIAMEEQRAMGNEEITPDSIRAFTSSMQGPIESLGVPISQSCVNAVLKSVGITMVLAGSMMGVGFTFFGMVIYKVIAWVLLTWVAYKFGGSAIEKLYSGGAADYITYVVGIIGCVAFGALAAASVSLSLGSLAIAGINLQTKLLDAILLGLLPMTLTLVCYSLISKKKISPIMLIIVIFVIFFILGAVGVFGT